MEIYIFREKRLQVKYKGYRIELEEIEFNLGKLETKEVSVIKAI